MQRSRTPGDEGDSWSTDLPGAVRSWSRVEILLSIAQRPSSVSNLAARHELDDSIVCKLLGEFSRLGLVAYVQNKHHRVYSLCESARVHWSEHEVEIALWSETAGQLAYRIPMAVLKRKMPWLFEDHARVTEVKPRGAPKARPTSPGPEKKDV